MRDIVVDEDCGLSILFYLTHFSLDALFVEPVLLRISVKTRNHQKTVHVNLKCLNTHLPFFSNIKLRSGV